MPTSRELTQQALERARIRLGSDAPIVKTLEAQLAASPGETAQDLYLNQGLRPAEKKPAQ